DDEELELGRTKAVRGVLERSFHGAADLHLVGHHPEFDTDGSLDFAGDNAESLGNRQARTKAANHQLDGVGEVRREFVNAALDHLADDEVRNSDATEQSQHQGKQKRSAAYL